MEKCLVVLEIVLDDWVDVVGKELSDFVFLGVYLILYVFDAVFGGLGPVLKQLLDVTDKFIYHCLGFNSL